MNLAAEALVAGRAVAGELGAVGSADAAVLAVAELLLGASRPSRTGIVGLRYRHDCGKERLLSQALWPNFSLSTVLPKNGIYCARALQR